MLLLIADGPRIDRDGEHERCSKVRELVEDVDWPCKVLKNYSEVNLGCRKRVSSGITWVFKEVEEAIILEDDCLPDPSFFPFCEEMLTYYRHDERIMLISGDNFQFGNKRTQYGYYFSRYTHIWGWASWRRSWQLYDVDISLWPEIRNGSWLIDLLCDHKLAAYWQNIFDRVYSQKIDTWDYQLTFTAWINNALTILPNTNLVSNIGFGSEATHTREKDSTANLPTESISFPVAHPRHLIRDSIADSATEKLYLPPTWYKRRLQRAIKDLKKLFISTSFPNNL